MTNNATLFLTIMILGMGILAAIPGALALRSGYRNGRAAYVAAEAIQEDVSRQITRLSNRVAEMEKENLALRGRLDQAEIEIAELERRNGELVTAVRRLVGQVGRLGKEPEIDAYLLGRLLS